MAHPAIANDEKIPGPLYCYKWDGQQWVLFSTLEKLVMRRRRFRPQSVHTHRRVDLTRPPTDWWANGGSESGSSGSLQYRLNGIGVHREQGYLLTQANSWFRKADNSLVVMGSISPDPSLSTNIRLAALKSMTEREVQFNTSLREAGGTLKMIGDACRHIAKTGDNLYRNLVSAFQGKRLSKPISSLTWKEIPSKYLEYLYGWRQLDGDLQNAFDRQIVQRNLGERYRVAVRKSGSSRVETQVWTKIGSGFCEQQGMMQAVEHASVVYYFEYPEWYQDGVRREVTPFGNLWEQTPYSFVADWVIPIGNWVGAMEAMQFAPFFKEGCFRSHRTRTISTIGQANSGSPGVADVSGGPLGYSFKDYEYVRSAITDLHGEIWNRPPLRNPLSIDHAAQGLSLITQALKRWSRF